MNEGLGRISAARRVKARLGIGILGVAAGAALVVLLWLLWNMVQRGGGAVFNVSDPWGNVRDSLAPYVMLGALQAVAIGAAVAIAAGTGLAAFVAWSRRRQPARVRRAPTRARAPLARLRVLPALALATFHLAFVPPGASPVPTLGLAVLLLLPRAYAGASQATGHMVRQLWAAARRVAAPAALAVAAAGALALALSFLNLPFLTQHTSYDPERAGIVAGIVGTLLVGFASMLVALPIGIAAAIYLNEFASANRVTSFLRASISNLAGVPSIVFGILGLVLFVRAMALGTSIVSAGLTLGLLTLPVVVVVSEEALKSVPNTMREAAFGLGASRWQVVRQHVLPYSLPGMLTGSILALSRTMGETAPLILIGAAAWLDELPRGWKDPFTALPIQAYGWAPMPQEGFEAIAWGAVLVLVLLVVAGNLAAIVARDRYQRRYRW